MRFPKRLVLVVAAVGATLAATTSARADFFICTPAAVAIVASKAVSVRCTTAVPPGNSIRYFGFSLKKKDAPLMLQMFLAAKAQGKDLVVLYDANDLSGQKIGCLPSECRLVLGLEIQS